MRKKLHHIQLTKKQIIAYVAGIIVVALLPLVVRGTYPRHVMIMIIMWSILGMGWNIIGGYAGQVSTGHAVFYGLGAYTVGILYKFFNVTPWVSIFLGMAISVFVSACIAIPLLRLKGNYFAVATMATAECGRIIFNNWQAVGGATGLDFMDKKANIWYSLQFSGKLQYYYMFLIVAVIVLLIVIYNDRSRFGYYLRAIKGNENAAESLGIDTTRYKTYAYMLSAAIVSCGGSLYALYMLYIDPPMLMVLKISLMICLVAVMGGVGTVLGPIIGAVVLTLVSEYTRVLAGGTGTGIDQIVYGVIVVVVVLFLPDGLLSLGRNKRLKKARAIKDGEVS